MRLWRRRYGLFGTLPVILAIVQCFWGFRRGWRYEDLHLRRDGLFEALLVLLDCGERVLPQSRFDILMAGRRELYAFRICRARAFQRHIFDQQAARQQHHHHDRQRVAKPASGFVALVVTHIFRKYPREKCSLWPNVHSVECWVNVTVWRWDDGEVLRLCITFHRKRAIFAVGAPFT